ncbi:hypothetical protein TSOC_009014 [Tetrabaena socialis]|uniref:Uncharacterized protein n=1 Tax=Tetrabaena socialis TaxID=47790 RepID=A0A2J7ZWX7_9CHLO|nr:hypothetical protein TSOC_009014 [Tetrabaena socialis]|eukprot:PNH04780.1 hypothetical protein TSOC_009014 [Tetrabaena socialis]
MAATTAAPELMPQKRPSSVASRIAIATASSLPTCGGTLVHPDPASSSVDEVRWRHYQAVASGAAPAAAAAAAGGGGGGLAAAFGGGLSLAGAPAAGAAGAAVPAPAGAPLSPFFPTPVRTLFPPTPPPAGPAAAGAGAGAGGLMGFGGAAAPAAPGSGGGGLLGFGGAAAPLFGAAPLGGAGGGLALGGLALGGLLPLGGGAALGADEMDTAEAPPDAEGQLRCIYAVGAAAGASPEEMRLVQVESYRAGRQVAPYWMSAGGAAPGVAGGGTAAQ